MSQLDVLIEEIYGQYQQELAEEEAAKQSQKQAEDAAKLADFKTALEAELGVELIAELSIRYRLHNLTGRNNEPLVAGAWFKFEDVTFTIEGRDIRADQRPHSWEIDADRLKGYGSYFHGSYPEGNARVALLVGLGTAREARAKERAEEQRQAEENEKKRAQDKARLQADQADHAAVMADARLLHAQLEAHIDAVIAATPVWQWPSQQAENQEGTDQGRTATFYRISWNTGASGEGYDYETGFTITDRLGDDGYITVYPARMYTKTRTVKLDVQTHKVVWERIAASSLADLKADVGSSGFLTESVDVEFPGIYWRNYDGEQLLTSDEKNGYIPYSDDYDNHVMRRAVGQQPVDWIRRLVDAAATEKE